MINTNFTSSDNELFESIQQGDQHAFTIVYRKYWKPLYLVAYHRLNQKEIAEELVQDLFVKFWRKRQELQVAHVEHYLFRAIKFAVIDYIRSQAVQGKFDEYYQTFACLEDCQTENLIAYRDLSDAIDKRLDSLPEKSKQAFQLSRLEGWSVSRIADHLRLSDKAVEYHLTKSLKALRIYLKEFILSIIFLGFWH